MFNILKDSPFNKEKLIDLYQISELFKKTRFKILTKKSNNLDFLLRKRYKNINNYLLNKKNIEIKKFLYATPMAYVLFHIGHIALNHSKYYFCL